MSDLRHDELCSSPSSDSGLVDTATLTEAVRAVLRRDILNSGCLCESSRCPIHGEGTGSEVRALAALSALDERLREALARERTAETIMGGLHGRAVDAEARLEEAQRAEHLANVIQNRYEEAIRRLKRSNARAVAAEASEKALIEALEAIDVAEADRYANSTGVAQAADDTSLVQRIARAVLVGVRGEENAETGDEQSSSCAGDPE